MGQPEKETSYDIPYRQSLKEMIQMNIIKIGTDSRVDLTGGIMGERDREFGIHRHTLLYLKQITNMVLLYSTGKSAQHYVVAWIERGLEIEWIHVYV